MAEAECSGKRECEIGRLGNIFRLVVLSIVCDIVVTVADADVEKESVVEIEPRRTVAVVEEGMNKHHLFQIR